MQYGYVLQHHLIYTFHYIISKSNENLQTT
jgi:hypothetical protein